MRKLPPSVAVSLIPYIDGGEVVAGAALVEPQLSGAVVVMGFAHVRVPVDVADMSPDASLDETDRDEREDAREDEHESVSAEAES